MKEKVFLGVCVWLSERLNVSLTGLRIVWVLLIVAGIKMPLLSISPILLYFIFFLLKPKNGLDS